jgi:hypothetical protein
MGEFLNFGEKFKFGSIGASLETALRATFPLVLICRLFNLEVQQELGVSFNRLIFHLNFTSNEIYQHFSPQKGDGCG